MLMLRGRRPDCRTLEGWAVAVLVDAGAIAECPDHGHRRCRGDPDAHARAFDAARANPPAGLSPDQAVTTLYDVLGGIGDTCPDC